MKPVLIGLVEWRRSLAVPSGLLNAISFSYDMETGAKKTPPHAVLSVKPIGRTTDADGVRFEVTERLTAEIRNTAQLDRLEQLVALLRTLSGRVYFTDNVAIGYHVLRADPIIDTGSITAVLTWDVVASWRLNLPAGA